MLSYILIILGVMIIAFFLLRATRQAARNPRPSPIREALRDPAAEAQVRGDLDHLLTQIQEISREHIARLDTKIRLLRQLLEEADRKIQALRDITSPQEAAAAPPEPPEEPELHHTILRLADEGLAAPEIARRVGHPEGEVELILGLRRLRSPPPG